MVEDMTNLVPGKLDMGIASWKYLLDKTIGAIRCLDTAFYLVRMPEEVTDPGQ